MGCSSVTHHRFHRQDTGISRPGLYTSGSAPGPDGTSASVSDTTTLTGTTPGLHLRSSDSILTSSEFRLRPSAPFSLHSDSSVEPLWSPGHQKVLEYHS